MPPFIPKKRHATTTPPPAEPSVAKKKPKLVSEAKPKSKSLPKRQKGKQPVYTISDDDSDSSLSSVDSVEFQNVALGKSPGKNHTSKPTVDSDNSDESDEVEWENAIHQQVAEYVPKEPAKVSGDVQFSLEADEDEFGGFAAAALQRKQGISKAEKATRVAAHQLHVQFLLLHNAFRNRWISDKTVQKILIDQLPAQIKSEVDKWRRASGYVEQDMPKGKVPKKKQKAKKERPVNPREERDWGRPSLRLEEGKADMSSGDPIISLLKVLSAYWKKRFAVTAPGLRKRGYSTRLERRKEVTSFKNDPHDPEKHGERIQNLKEFREMAKKCEGSRDVGAQLFTALLRGLGIEARLVASLQPAGFGATKAEEMIPKKPAESSAANQKPALSSSDSDMELADIETINETKKKSSQKSRKAQSARKSKAVVKVETSAEDSTNSEDDSVVDITPSVPKRRTALYDREVPHPIYWAEAISPVTSKVYPVSPLVLERAVATNEETLGSFEPRGAKAERAKLVIAYVVAYSPDGTAKDVTVRYLRKHIWPGKTKQFRYPIEKIPVYDRTGRIKRYEDYDWFKHIMGGYRRNDTMRTAVDDVEDATDLVPQQPEKKQIDDSVDTLSSLKASPDFVLERFLRREEAIRPGAEPDRTFVSGKGDGLKEEPVYRRSDVERCLTTESWHKEGRIPKLGEVPLKRVPVRAVTLTRKREAEEHERITGEKQLQGLYSWDQTEYIIPPPIENGVIPKNGYGNIDAFVPSMVPKGAAHIPLKGTLRICKKLEIDYAEAVVGFEFGNKRAIPVIKGVVVAKENEKRVREEWKKWNEEQKRKEEMKLEKLVLEMWRKFIVGLKIRKRVQAQYGEDVEMGSAGVAADGIPQKIMSGLSKAEAIDVDNDDEGEPGGFATEPASEVTGHETDAAGGGFFLPHSDEEMSEAGELVMEDHDDDLATSAPSRRRRIIDTDFSTGTRPPSEMAASGERPASKKSLLQQQADLDSSEEHNDEDTPLAPPPKATIKTKNKPTPRRVLSSNSSATNSQPPEDNSASHACDQADSEAASDEDEPSSPSSSSEEEDDYNPMLTRRSAARTSSTRRRMNKINDTPAASSDTSARRTSARRLTRSGGNAVNTSVNGTKPPALDQHMGSEDSVEQTPTRRQLKEDGQAVTSPYFSKTPGSAGRSSRSARKG